MGSCIKLNNGGQVGAILARGNWSSCGDTSGDDSRTGRGKPATVRTGMEPKFWRREGSCENLMLQLIYSAHLHEH